MDGQWSLLYLERLEVEEVLLLELMHPLVVAVQRLQVVVACGGQGQRGVSVVCGRWKGGVMKWRRV